MPDLSKTWKSFTDQKREWEEKWFSLIPWIVALDAGVLGIGLDHNFELQKEPWKFKGLIGFGMILVGVSFVLGFLFKKAEVDLEFSKTDELGKRYLKELDEARTRDGELPPEAVASGLEWAKAFKQVDVEVSRVNRFGRWTFYTFLVGIIIFGLGNLAIIFRPEIQSWWANCNCCCESVQKSPNTIPPVITGMEQSKVNDAPVSTKPAPAKSASALRKPVSPSANPAADSKQKPNG